MDTVRQPSVPARSEGAAAPEDVSLVAAVLRKDRKATAEFVERHADAVYAYVRSRVVPRVDLADDLVQEVFLAAWENLSQYRGASSLQSWLLGIARHKVQNYYRERLREAAPMDEACLDFAEVVEAGLDEFLDSERLQQKTQEVLASLPEAYSLALLWRYWEKRSVREMAALTGKTEKAMERLLARARRFFKRRWKGE